MEKGKETYTVVIADDHDGVRRGIRNIIERGESFQVVGEAVNGKEALQISQEKSPDLLILDVILPMLRGEEVANRLSKTNPEIKILALSSHDNPEYIYGMIESGAKGYLTKDEAPVLLQSAAREILENNASGWISERLREQSAVSLKSKIDFEITLSHIEHHILERLKEGKSEKDIAVSLNFTTGRLNRYIQILLVKFEVDSLEELMKKI